MKGGRRSFGTEAARVKLLYDCKVAREVVEGPRGPIVIIVEVIQCKVD